MFSTLKKTAGTESPFAARSWGDIPKRSARQTTRSASGGFSVRPLDLLAVFRCIRAAGRPLSRLARLGQQSD
jgi:hypothetical protein